MELTDVLVKEGIPARAIAAAAEVASSENRPLACLLVERGVIEEDRLADVLARSAGVAVVDLSADLLDPDAVGALPEEVARRFHVIAVARNVAVGAIHIAMVNPLDREAVAVVREVSGLEPEPFVATFSTLSTAIRRAYEDLKALSSRKTDGVGRSLAEVTRRLSLRRSGGEEIAASSTAPMHRIESEATAEQRHEALLLALVEAGVITRADYVRAIERLLGR